MLEVMMLVDSGEEPHSWLSYGHVDKDAFKAEVHRQEAEYLGPDEFTQSEIEYGWGRWVAPGCSHSCEKILKTNCWPIPLLNFRYTRMKI